ncbi:MAG: lipid A Kdo2 1-phosphate O-methyltransferase [Spirochaetota bacterium]
MALIEDLDRQGTFLFRWRSYVPSVILLLSFVYIRDYRYVGGSYETHLLFMTGCFCVSLLGVLVRALTIGFTPERTSGRNTKKQVADEVNLTGMYSIWRHPLYIGNFLIFLGIVLTAFSLSFVLIFILFYWFYYERIIFTEEQFMRNKFGRGYLDWADKTPVFLPALAKYQAPRLGFSFRNILKREYPTLAGAIAAFTIYDLAIIYYNQPELWASGWKNLFNTYHAVFFGFGFVFYVFVRTIVKTTRLLHVEGR